MGNVIAFLSLLIAILVSWNQIIKTFKDLGGTFNKLPFLLFEVITVSLSGLFVSGIFWIMYDYLAVTANLSLEVVLRDIANGAVWGLPIAVLTAFTAKNTGRAIVISMLIGVALLMIYGPDNVIKHPIDLNLRQMYAIAIFLWTVMLGATSGYVGLKVKAFIDANWADELKSDRPKESLQ